jgi:choice-of-anchor A domain-containing protein
MKKQMKFLGAAALLCLAPGAALADQKTWTLDGDFDTGVLDGVNHTAPNNHQLQLDSSSRTDPYIWIANYDLGTVTKMDTRTGRQLAKYDSVLVRNWDGSIPAVRPPRERTSAGNCNSPSRTAVDGHGNAFVVNRAICSGNSASATKFAVDLSQCVDRNGNGTIDTSRDLNGDGIITMASGEFVGQADECILWTKNYAAVNDWGRSAAVDADQNLWVGGYHTSKLYKLNGSTGALMKVIDPRAQTGRVSYIYGIAIGSCGHIYTSDISGRILLKIDPSRASGTEVVGTLISPVPTYGLAVDRNNIVWLGNWSTNQAALVRADFAAGTVTLQGASVGGCTNPNPVHGGRTRGVAVDGNGDVWTSCWSDNRLLRFNSAGVFLGSWPVGAGPVGAAVDSDGRVWTVNQSSDTATRYDPATGATQSFPTTGHAYSYSDMTGFQQRNFTTRQGDWTAVHDSGRPDSVWGVIRWNTEPQGSVPANTSITVEARAANTIDGLATVPYQTATNGAAIPGLTGRYFEVRTTLRILGSSGTCGQLASPILSDVSVSYEHSQQCIDINLDEYNLFVENDYNLGTDVEGKVAAGGNITMNNFSVGHVLDASNLANTLVAGGNLTLTNGGVWGEAAYGGSYSADGTVVFPRGNSATAGTPINFAARFSELRGLSSRLGSLAANGNTSYESWGGIMLQGTNPDVNVFEVNASAFTGATLFYIEAPAGSLAVVNVRGASARFSGFGISFGGGIDQHGVLYNFVDATSITANGFGFWGTVLAPNADVNFSNGSFDGGFYAKSFTGYAEGHINGLNDRQICQ